MAQACDSCDFFLFDLNRIRAARRDPRENFRFQPHQREATERITAEDGLVVGGWPHGHGAEKRCRVRDVLPCAGEPDFHFPPSAVMNSASRKPTSQAHARSGWTATNGFLPISDPSANACDPASLAALSAVSGTGALKRPSLSATLHRRAAMITFSRTSASSREAQSPVVSQIASFFPGFSSE